MHKNPWFRMYTEAVDDEKLRLLAFEDRWHYVAILCLKGQGLLDDESDHQLRLRKIAVKMGVQLRELDEISRRLSEVGLIDQNTLQPVKWDMRQFRSDTSRERVAKHRENQKKQQDEIMKRECNVTVTPPETDTDTDTDKEERSKSEKKPTRFTPPTVDEVGSYCKERNNSINPQRFVDFYESKGWVVGTSKMKSWKAAVRSWEARQQEQEPVKKRRML